MNESFNHEIGLFLFFGKNGKNFINNDEKRQFWIDVNKKAKCKIITTYKLDETSVNF